MKHLLIFLAGLSGCFGVASCAESQARTNWFETLTLGQAIELGQRFHPDLAEAKALVDAARGWATQAGAFPNPHTIVRMESAPVGGRTVAEAEYVTGFSQPIPLGRRLDNAREVARLEGEKRGLELTARQVVLHKRIHGAFATALYQERAFRLQSEIAAGVAKLVSTAQARVEAGDALPAELARAQMELARCDLERNRSEILRSHAMTGLKAAIGDPELVIGSLSGDLDAAFDIATLQTLVAASGASPEVAVADAEMRVSEARVDLAKSERIPDIQVDVLYRRLAGTRENGFDIGVSIPLPIFDRNQGRVREARAEMEAAQARLRSSRNTANLRWHDARTRLSSALTVKETMKIAMLLPADTILKAYEARFSAGDISFSELLPIRRDWVALQLAYLESLRDVMQAWSELKSLVSINRNR